MDDVKQEDKRDCVRAPLSGDVYFRVIDEAGYEAKKTRVLQGAYSLVTHSGLKAALDEEDFGPAGASEKHLVDFLVHMDDKLNRILRLLTDKERGEKVLLTGEGLDIAGGGMRILSDRELRPGQILELSFQTTRYPLSSLDVYGKVVRVMPVRGEGGRNYEVAISFLDLEDESREFIIAYVFQMQREAIRRQKRSGNE